MFIGARSKIRDACHSIALRNGVVLTGCAYNGDDLRELSYEVIL